MEISVAKETGCLMFEEVPTEKFGVEKALHVSCTKASVLVVTTIFRVAENETRQAHHCQLQRIPVTKVRQ